MSVLVDALSWILLILGSVVMISGGIGLVRLPDFFTRLHSAGVIDTLGSALVVVGLIVQTGLELTSLKLLLILVFLFFTSPTSTHAIAHAALVGGLRPWTKGQAAPSEKDEI